MRRQRWLSVGVVFVANFLFFVGLGWSVGAYPAQAELAVQAAPTTEAPSAGFLQLTKVVTPAIVFNGGQITYTIYITNNSASQAATSINLVDPLPAENWANITCSNNCGRVVEEIPIPEPLGGVITITVIRQLTWTIPSLAPNAAISLTFSAQVLGQADGTVLSNIAYASYQQGGTQVNNTNPANATVRTFIPQNGQSSFARTATWYSEDFGGTISQDWGDFDRDGDVDMVLGSSVGTTVYQNNNGQLDQYWTDSRRSYGVRWADVNNDKQLELIAVGNSSDNTANGVGYNYVFTRTTTGFAEATNLTFTSTKQLVRLTLGDFDGDKFLDLVASTNAINATCPVLLYRNNGTGRFTNVAGINGCVSDEATAALSVGDIDNDDRGELVLGRFPDQIVIIKLRSNSGGTITQRTPITLEASIPFLPYDFAWGDYNNDGWLDLAAAFPLQKEVRFYQNLGASNFAYTAALQTDTFLSPLGIDWADLNGDGWLDLVVADVGPKIYLNQAGLFSTDRVLAANAVSGQTWSIRAAQSALSGNPQIAATRRDGPSLVYPVFTGYLAQDLQTVETAIGNSVAWGDATGDGYLDLLIGAGPLNFASRLYTNRADGTFISPPRNFGPSGLGPHETAFGDVNRDGNLDVAIGTPFGIQVYLANATNPSWTAPTPGNNPVIAWGDANDDGALDLLVGGLDSRVILYPNQGITLSTQPITVTSQNGEVRELAWMDYNQDYFLDFAVAYYDRPAQVYRNNQGDGTFSLAWTSPIVTNTTSVAWGDYNRDGYPDLALGALGYPVKIFDNLTGTLNTTEAWSSPTISQTSSVAWGDWNNDGYLDLAIGNDNDLVQVYANLASTRGSPNFYWLWASRNAYVTTQVAWGDADRDGDLDLALSQTGTAANGFFRNQYVRPGHLVASGLFTPTMTLPNNASYVAVARPGQTKDAYFFSSGELLGDPTNSPTVTVRYRVYDPDGTRTASNLDAPGPTIVSTLFEYSLDGGSTWRTATAAISSPVPITQTSRLGRDGVFIWDAAADDAISSNARFRVTTIINDGSGPLRRAGSVAISPPFRLRATSCTWPTNPSISVTTTNPSPGQNIRFQGALQGGSGVLTFTWNFGDGSPNVVGQTVYHTYTTGIYTARLTVSGQPCPENRDVTASVVMYVGVSPNLTIRNYLPFVRRGNTALADATLTQPPALNSGVSAEAPETTDNSSNGDTTNNEVSSQPPILMTGESSPPPDVPLSSHVQPEWLPTAATISLIQVTSSTVGFNNAPVIDSDGTRIVFWSTADLVGENSDGNIELFLADLATTTVSTTVNFVQLTESTGSILGGFNLGPSISADGEWVAFFSDRNLSSQNPDGNFEVFVAYISPSTEVTITQVTSSTGGFNILPSLAPTPSVSGQHIAFISDRNYLGTNADGNSEVFHATLTPSGTITYTQVTSSTGGTVDQPVMSDGGLQIAFLSDQASLAWNGFNTDGNREVFLAQTITSTGQISITQVTSTTQAVVNTQPFLSGNGQRLTYVSNQRPYTAEVVGTGNVIIGPGLPITGEQPSLSFDGTRMAFLSAGKREISLYDLVYNKVLTIAAPNASDIFSPRISGDGTQIVLAHNRQIYLAAYPYAEILVTKIASPPPIYPGMDLIYTLTVINNGPSIATTVTLTDTLPPAIASLTFVPSGCTGTTVIQCNLGDIPARQNRVLTIGVTLPNTYFVTLTNTVIITATSNEIFTNDNQTAVSVTIGPRPITSVVINAPPTTTVYMTEAVQAIVVPPNASLPISYFWSTTGPTLGPSAITNTNQATITNAVNYQWRTGGYYTLAVTAQNASSVVSATQGITVFNPVPTITAYAPTTRTANGPSFTLNLTGTDYVLSSTVLWNGSPRTTTFITATRLQATINASDIITAGFYTVTVINPGPGGGLANAVVITVENPVPQLTAVTPNSVTVNSPTRPITLTGSNFTVQSIARWDGGTHLPTTFVNGNTITALLTNTLLTLASPHTIDVFNPAPAGGISAAQPFTVNNPSPTLNQLLPVSTTAGSPGFTLILDGSNFFSGATVYWDGAPVATTFISSTRLQATISATLLTPATSVPVWVDNPSPNLGLSNSLNFSRDTLHLWFTPNAAAFEVYSDTQGAFTANINAVQANNTGVTLTLANGLITTSSIITIPAGLTQTAFTANIGLVNGYSRITGTLPANVGGLTTTALITINNPYPILSRIAPTMATVGGYTFTLLLHDDSGAPHGSFVANSQVKWEGNILASTLVNSRTLSVAVPYTYLDQPVPYGITVFNPAPGGGNTVTQTISLAYPTISLKPAPLFLHRASTGTVTLALNTALAQNTPVTITTSNATIAQITSTVIIIPAGNISTTFAVSNPVVGTGGIATITADLPAALGGAQDNVVVNVIDLALSPAPTATLMLNADTLSATGTLTLTRIPAAAGVPLTIALTSSYTQVASVPAAVFMPVGMTTTTFVYSSTLAGVAVITAFDNTTPNGPYTATTNVVVSNPQPQITAVNPPTTTAGVPNLQITITGQNFISGAVATYNGISLTTSFSSSSQLTAIIPAVQLVPTGTASLMVYNPAPTVASSNAWPFTREPLQMWFASAIWEYTIYTPDDDVANPYPGYEARINAIQANPTRITITTLNGLITAPTVVTIPAGTLFTNFSVGFGSVNGYSGLTGTLPVNVGGLTNTAALTINNPLPSLTTLTPAIGTVGGFTLTLTLTDSNPSASPVHGFVVSSVVQWNGTPLTSAFVNSRTLTAVVPSSFLTAPTGSRSVTVFNSAPGGGTTTQTVNLAYPTLLISPDTLLLPRASGANTTGTMTVTLNTPLVQNTTITLTTSDPKVASVVTSITQTTRTIVIPAGTLSVSFPITNIRTGGTPGTAIITATLPSALGSGQDTATVIVNSLDISPAPTATLTLDIANLATTGTLTVSRIPAPSTDLAVFLSSTDSNVAQVPTVVTITASTTSVTFGYTSTQAGTATVTATDGTYTATTNVVVSNPQPTILDLSPLTVTAGSVTQTLIITGQNFVSPAVVAFGSFSLTTTFVNSTSLTATVPVAELVPANPVAVTIVNPAPYVNVSNAWPFTRTPLGISLTPIANNLTFPVPASLELTAIIDAPQANATVITLTSSNSGIGAVPATVTIPAGALTATVPVTIGSGRSATITASLPTPVGGLTATSSITIPGPNLTVISPTNWVVYGMPLTLTLTGTNFVSNTQVLWNGLVLTNVISSTDRITAIVPTLYLTSVLPSSVWVNNPAPGGGASLTQTVNLTYPTFSLTPNPLFAPANGSRTMTVTSSDRLGVNVLISLALADPGTDWGINDNSNDTGSATLISGNFLTTFIIQRDNGTDPASITATFPITISPIPLTSSLQPIDIAFVPGGTLSLTLNVATLRVTNTTVITRNPAAPGGGVTILLNSTNGSIAQVPASVNMGGGSTSTSFVLASTLAGTAWITATDNSNGGPYTDTITVTVNNPAPNITGVVPSTLPAGIPTQTITITGQGFVTNAVAYFGGVPLSTTVVTSRTLLATVPPPSLIPSRTATVTVLNVAPTIGPSNSFPFSVTALGLTLTPASQGITTTLPTVVNFTATVSAAQHLATPISVTSSNPAIAGVPAVVTLPPGALNVSIPVTLTAPGTALITATLPVTLGGASDTSQVNTAGPSLIAVSPTTGTVYGITRTLTLTGTGFQPDVQVLWDGNPVSTTYGSATLATATVSATLLTPVGNHSVQVQNATEGTSPSAALTVVLTYPTVSLTPTTVYMPLGGSSAFTASLNVPLGVDADLTITTSNANVVTVPVTITIPGGSLAVTFPVTSPVVGSAGRVTITAILPSSLGSGQAIATAEVTTITLTPDPATLTLNPYQATRVITITRQPAPTTNRVISLTSGVTYTQVPANVTLLANNTTITATITGTLAGTAIITATDNSPGGPYTDSITVNLFNPQPVINAVNPPTVTAGSPPTVITLTGQNFITGAVLHIDGQPLFTVVQASTQLTALVPPYTLPPPVRFITVVNQGPSAGPSISVPFTVTPLSLVLLPSTISVTYPLTPALITLTAQIGSLQNITTPVAINTSNPGVITGPISVTIPPGSLAVSVPLTVVSSGNAIITGTLPGPVGALTSTSVITLNTSLLMPIGLSAQPANSQALTPRKLGLLPVRSPAGNVGVRKFTPRLTPFSTPALGPKPRLLFAP